MIDFLMTHWGVCAAILTVCSLYFSWKVNGGGIFSFDPKPGHGSANVIGEILMLIGYIGFSVGMVAIAAIVAGVMRIILVITAIAAFNAGATGIGLACLGFTVVTGVVSFVAYRHSKTNRARR